MPNKQNHQKRIVFIFKKKNIYSFEKNGPTEFLYGLDFVQKKITAVSFFANQYQFKHLPFMLLEKFIACQTNLGIYFQAYLNNKKNFMENDLLFAINDGAGFGLLFFKYFGKLNNKIIILVQGLHDRQQKYHHNIFFHYFHKKLLNQAEIILTLSVFEKELLIKLYQLNPQKVQVLYFGADLNFWNIKNLKKEGVGDYVITAGNDMHRDYNLLINGYNLNIPLKLITRVLNKEQLKKINNNLLFEYYQEINNILLRQLFYQAKFAIIPQTTTSATSGLSTTLQLLALGKPVLIADAPALKELFQDYQHVLYYQTANLSSFQEKIYELNNNKKLRERLSNNGKKLIEEKFNSKNMGKNILKIIKPLIDI